jgi:hypothetical protein
MASSNPLAQAQQPRSRQHQPQPQLDPSSTPRQRIELPGIVPGQRNANRLGDYRIVRTLGEGSFGKVRRKSKL